MEAKWYILHATSGSENGVKRNLEDQINKKGMTALFEEIQIPVVEVPEIKRGKQVISQKKFMPGYILVKMIMTDESWHLVKSIAKISGFLGTKTKPTPITEAEAEKIFNQSKSQSKTAGSSSLYKVGDKIKVIDGPFDSCLGVVEEVNDFNEKLKISVSIFGKAIPIELSFTQVSKD